MSLKHKLLFNTLIRVSIESYLIVTMGAFDNLKDNFNFSDGSETTNSVLVLITLVYIVFLPIFFYRFLHNKFLYLSDRTFKAQYGSMYLNVEYF